ncbi:RND family efflux transporter, MFP subunit [Rubidibacter lacunae KORDI 51-2]|uniref:RND family efflux transporter, MFP subunit n=1 Tax=Rubidibacter lacunae KORDI 51-2 TaxID=582515 RepID=U5DHM8_9CHRO|nr:efflux RND transporter periplasmic adaptor subunit [Rubidibacter lacunae]ERN40089.1 RND family efflux transporter, MFP subunit [Rubidibacter lacunae KORDI 51-2]
MSTPHTDRDLQPIEPLPDGNGQQPVPNESSSRPSLWLLLVPLLFLFGGGLLWRFIFARGGGPPMMDVPAVRVKLAPVISHTVRETSEFVGLLEASERVNLSPRIEGRVVEILVNEGDRVSAGTPIIQLRPDRNQAEVDAAIANASIQQSALNGAQAEVRVVEANVASRQAEVRRAEANVRRREADLDLAQINYDRVVPLVSEGAQARQALDERTSELESARAEYEASLETLSVARNTLAATEQQSIATRTNVSQRQAALDQARADINALREDLEYNRIVTPIDGIVGDIPVEIGDYVEAGDELTTITQNDRLDFKIAVPVERALDLRLGLPVELRLGDSDEPVASGKIEFISPKVDESSQSILVEARFANPGGKFRDEQFARARIVWNARDGVLVPTSAIARLGGQAFVFTAESGDGCTAPKGPSAGGRAPGGAAGSPPSDAPVARQRPVELGGLQGNNYQVLSGLEAGETLIVSGIVKLTDCAAIAPQPDTAAGPVPPGR